MLDLESLPNFLVNQYPTWLLWKSKPPASATAAAAQIAYDTKIFFLFFVNHIFFDLELRHGECSSVTHTNRNMHRHEGWNRYIDFCVAWMMNKCSLTQFM